MERYVKKLWMRPRHSVLLLDAASFDNIMTAVIGEGKSDAFGRSKFLNYDVQDVVW